MAFTLPALTYDYTALEPYIDASTMNIHHTKHHQTYINNINAALDKFPELKSLGIVDLNKAVSTDVIPKDIATIVRNNGGGHYNHAFFWKVLGPPSDNNGPSDALKSAIDADFGSMDDMKAKFNAAAAARFGSGWAWLGLKPDGHLSVSSTANQDNTLQPTADEQAIPIIGLDVWEHAYYLKYQNRRPEYIAAFWKVCNWEQVNANYALALKGEVPL
ncbi:MAG: hypothetical protein WDW38_008808 [Sanguina aurantia]